MEFFSNAKYLGLEVGPWNAAPEGFGRSLGTTGNSILLIREFGRRQRRLEMVS